MNSIRKSRNNRPQADENPRISGDPGVGGMLADPLGSDASRDEIDPAAGAASADAPPPKHHQDWSPNRRPADRKESRKA